MENATNSVTPIIPLVYKYMYMLKVNSQTINQLSSYQFVIHMFGKNDLLNPIAETQVKIHTVFVHSV